ncbi:hypothetical protein GWI33_022034, partial [Rhynchophorus ferrugineus]
MTRGTRRPSFSLPVSASALEADNSKRAKCDFERTGMDLYLASRRWENTVSLPDSHQSIDGGEEGGTVQTPEPPYPLIDPLDHFVRGPSTVRPIRLVEVGGARSRAVSSRPNTAEPTRPVGRDRSGDRTRAVCADAVYLTDGCDTTTRPRKGCSVPLGPETNNHQVVSMVMSEQAGGIAMHHQLPMHHHQRGLVQPSLVMNPHPMGGGEGCAVDATQNKKSRRLSHCVGCGGQIHDQYILRVAPDLEWHAACLKCQECHMFLDESCTCFVRDGKTYCKRDYVKLFGTKCDKCGSSFSKNDFVMRAKSKIYHIDCFRCCHCARQLVPGDEFALREGGALYCKEDHDVIEGQKGSGGPTGPSTPHPGATESNNNTSLSNNNHSNNSTELGCMS